MEHNFFLTFVKADLGENISIQIDRDKRFKTELALLSREQRELLLARQRKDSGLFILSGDEKLTKKTLYSFLEFDLEKNKNIYSLEEEILHPLPFVKQISLSREDKKVELLLKVLEDYPDVLNIDEPKKSLLPVLFNYVSLSKKVFLTSERKAYEYFINFVDENYDRGLVVKNLSLFIEHQNFENILELEKEKYYLSKDEVRLIKSFLSDGELEKLLAEAGFLEDSKKKINRIPFYSSKKKKKAGLFKKKKIVDEIFSQREILGLVDGGLFLEKEFLKRHPLEKIKAEFKKEVKKRVLENALLASYMGEVDIREVLKYLTK